MERRDVARRKGYVLSWDEHGAEGGIAVTD